MNSKIFRKTLQLSENFKKEKCITPAEFVSNHHSDIEEDVIFHFLSSQRHDKVLQEISEHFAKYYNLPPKVNMTKLKLILYVLHASQPEDKNNIEELFVHLSKTTDVKNFLSYYADEENQLSTAHIACKYFENDYVMDNFIQPIVNNEVIFQETLEFVNQYRMNLYHKKLTVPIEMNVSKKPLKTPVPPVNTPEEIIYFHRNKIPKTTYTGDEIVKKKLQLEFDRNRQKADELLERVKKLPNYEKTSKPVQETRAEKVEFPKKIKRIPIRKEPSLSVKSNLTTIMREAALYAKEKELCIKEINEILRGGVDTKLTESIEEESRRLEEQKQLEELEKKRLTCLLSREDALIAKNRVKEINQEKKIQFVEEKKKLMKQLTDWKKLEREKYKRLIEKANKSKRNVKKSEEKMIKQKQCDARLLQWESKMLLDKAMKEKEKELERKMQLIQEIKAISQVKALCPNKEFDRTECPNLGLLCEMSIAELDERLYFMKQEMANELEEKKKCIRKNKVAKERMLSEAKEFIDQNRTKKEKPKPKTEVTIEESEEIKELRRKLETAKKLRGVN